MEPSTVWVFLLLRALVGNRGAGDVACPGISIYQDDADLVCFAVASVSFFQKQVFSAPRALEWGARAHTHDEEPGVLLDDDELVWLEAQLLLAATP
eukprot:8942632-Pyramimonas_sp.AAC.1